jgi:predicted esterase
MQRVCRGLLWALMGTVAGLLPLVAMADTPKMGIVIMHGKGGSPNKFVDELAGELKKKGYEVANLEMPWSGNRDYDVDTTAADAEIDKAIASLRAAGAQKIFVSGHSQGGAYALHYGATHEIDGVAAIVPGGNPDSRLFREKLGASVRKAKKLVAAGKGDEKVNLQDYEGSRGANTIRTTPNIYLTWFSSDSAMNYRNAVRHMSKKMPVLWVESTRDYPGLRKYNLEVVDELPRNALNQLVEPEADHLGAPTASIDIVADWTAKVATAK